MSFDVNETLLSGDLPADVLPHLLWNELLTGVEQRRVFLEAVQTTDMLRGAVGTKISVPAMTTRFSATTISEATLDASGYTPSQPTITDTDITIGNEVYVAFRISDILKEDMPKFDWIRVSLRDAGRAIAEYEDAAIKAVLLAGPGNTISAGTGGTLKYDDVIDILARCKEDSWYPEGGYKPILFIHSDQEADLLKDTRYVVSHRYAIGELPDLPDADNRTGDSGIYGDCRVRVTEGMTKALALVVFPTHPTYGPVVIHAYKRPLTVRTDREELYGRQLWVASMRYGTSIIQANGVGLISNC